MNQNKKSEGTLQSAPASVSPDTEKYLLPASWAGYFINNDDSGLEPAEREEIQEWLRKIAPGACIDADVANAAFTWSGADSNGTPGNLRCEYTFRVK